MNRSALRKFRRSIAKSNSQIYRQKDVDSPTNACVIGSCKKRRIAWFIKTQLRSLRGGGTKWHCRAMPSRRRQFPQLADDVVFVKESEFHMVAQNGTK
jgi:hypothetical protein